MVRVKNSACVRRLALKSLRANRARNTAAVLAIALTSLLFTALFTITMSVNASFQESNFRMVGGYAHGSFKRLTPEQYDELKTDPLIKEYGLHRFLGGAEDSCFAKTNVEIHHWDHKAAEWSYCVPTVGSVPAEGSSEAAADLAVLRYLGVEPEIGARFTVTLEIDGVATEQTFSLSGWWEGDAAAAARIILIPESRVDEVLRELGHTPPYTGLENGVGSWGMDVMLKSSRHIETDLETVLERHGYQNADATRDNYIGTGVNWGYTGARMAAGMDAQTVSILALLLFVILLTGYLVIYNVFRISVAGDVRFFGLLKTVGTTGRQIRRVIRLQALALSAIGIPPGLLLGWLTGGVLVPAVLDNLSVGSAVKVSARPVLFLCAAAFSLATVLMSCAIPGRLAAKVSPVEAARYTEGPKNGKTRRRPIRVSPASMAWANLGRSRSKTAVTVLSLALAVVLLSMTVFFTNGFDMNKYLRDKTACDFLVASNSYFRADPGSEGVTQDVVAAIRERGGISEGGRMYFRYADVEEIVPEEHIISYFCRNYPTLGQSLLKSGEPAGEGKRTLNAMVYGAEAFLLDRLNVIEGDPALLSEPSGRYVAAVCAVDDYGNIIDGSSWARAGDTVTLRHVERYEYYDTLTGRILNDDEDFGE
ncbi:MAG: ABC transporter permease, partial [Oscillospiraceae bacterium]|nr:ABC transporter permease [Oscillospiraceae bacterium]